MNLLSSENDYLECQTHKIQQNKNKIIRCSKVMHAVTGNKNFLYGLIGKLKLALLCGDG